MADKLMCVLYDKTQNYPFSITFIGWNVWTLNVPTNQNSLKVSKVVKPTIKKTLWNFSDYSVINSQMTDYSLENNRNYF